MHPVGLSCGKMKYYLLSSINVFRLSQAKSFKADPFQIEDPYKIPVFVTGVFAYPGFEVIEF